MPPTPNEQTLIALERMSTAVQMFQSETAGLRADVVEMNREYNKDRHRDNRTVLGFFLIVVLILALSQVQRSGSVGILREIKSCTSPAGKCYQDGARRTGAAIKELNKHADRVNRCTVTAKTGAEYDKCVAAVVATEP